MSRLAAGLPWFVLLSLPPEADASTPWSSEPAAQTSRAPAFHNTRFFEDWSRYLGDGSQHRWPSLKRISIGNGSGFVSLGGQFRLRGEVFRNFGFGGTGSRDSTYGLLRVRLHSDVRWNRHFRFFVEGKSSLAQGRDLPGGNRILDTDSIALQNAFVDAAIRPDGNSTLTWRVGRRELQFGGQRLVSPLDWSNTRPRSFDGISSIWQKDRWRIEGFWARPVQVRKYSFNKTAAGSHFFGVYAEGGAGGLELDLYWLGLDQTGAAPGGLVGREQRHSFGVRFAGSAGSAIDFDLEAAVQTGDDAGRRVRAAMIGSQIGWRPDSSPSTRFFTGFDFASGDGDPADDRVGTFNQLFPLGHAYLGHVDAIGRQNILAWNQGLSVAAAHRLDLTLTHHVFWRADNADALYTVAGGVLRPATAGAAAFVGNELDIDGTFRADRHIRVGFGFGYFRAGRFLEQSGSSDNIFFWYNSLQYTF